MACNGTTKELCLPLGEMRHSIAIQSTSKVSDGYGGYAESWSTDATVWAKIEPAGGRETWMAQQLQTRITHKITCRYNSAITAAKRILFGSRVFNIVQVLNVLERNVKLEILAVEGDTQAIV